MKQLFLRSIGWTALMTVLCASACTTTEPAMSANVTRALAAAGTNQVELARALKQTPPSQRKGMQFLIENMPPRDLQTLPAAFLLEHAAQAYEARAKAPWRDRLTDELFFNNILPYANVTETRETWRRELRALCLPWIEKCRTPGEAALRINENLFRHTGVKYSTQRARADQSPSESIKSGKASCTGLSILLADACRAVGIPARLAGIPNWTDSRGNHTWVEVWDGDWHFVGAAEPDPQGLDHAWFNKDAARAIEDEPEHSIFAVSYRRTATEFPLVWARDADPVYAVNVTARYKTAAPPEPPANTTRAMIEVAGADGRRVPAQVTVTRAGDSAFEQKGFAKDEASDRNAFLDIDLPTGAEYIVRAEYKGRRTEARIKADGAQKILRMQLKP